MLHVIAIRIWDRNLITPSGPGRSGFQSKDLNDQLEVLDGEGVGAPFLCASVSLSE